MILSRREFLGTSAAGLALPALAGEVSKPIAFFVVGDTHLLVEKSDPKKLDARSAKHNAGLVDSLNKLPGTSIPAAAGGGTVLAPRGLIHAGDCIDSGDKPNIPVQQSEWAAFTDHFGLTGKDGRLKMPVYEVHGNHDSPRGDGLAIQKIAERNKTRPGVTNVSTNGVHYSWDWGRVHFLCLGIVVGEVKDVMRKRRYAPLGSLDFLIADLKEKVGTSGRPVVITHHVDMLRYAAATGDEKALASKEWDPADVKGYHDALKGYNVAAIFYGHTHARNIYRWDGSAKAAMTGIPTFNVDNSAHFISKAQAFYYVQIGDKETTVREYQTSDGWETGAWTPQVWTSTIPA